MLAHEQAQMLNASKLASSMSVSGQTISRYVDLLCDLTLLRRLHPRASNVGKRLVRAPKIYVRDSGIVHALLGLPTYDSVLGHPVAERSRAPVVSRGFHQGVLDVGATAAFVVHSGADTFSLGNGVTAISLLELTRRLSALAFQPNDVSASIT
jgi:uncharacterized protein